MKINNEYLNLKDSYLFSEIAKRVNSYKEAHPEKEIIKLGIGDVTRPLAPIVVDAMKKACDEMGVAETFKGYGEEQGYGFLRSAIKGYYAKKGVTLDESEIFISDGAKSDCGNILDIFANDGTVLIPNPVYPVYLDTNIMVGRTPIFMDANKSNGFLPMPNYDVKADIIYLCSPNNPTGAVYNHEQLKAWVDYALANEAVILFDSAYECFVQGDLPTSIFEVEGAKKCAIELCSLSKTAGFTGTRCGYTVVPDELVCGDVHLRKLWLRRQSTKFNGVSYVVQRGAEAVFSEEGQQQVAENIKYYQENAKIMADTLTELGIFFTGGVNSPYLWFECPMGMDSWAFFDYLLENCGIVGTPGVGFGDNGEGYFRLTAFNNRENTIKACEKLKSIK